mgnify:FL=1
MKNTDIAVIGAGIAGLTSAIYSGRAGLETIVFEKNITGGQLASAPLIENYPGFSAIEGNELAAKIKNQALENGALIEEFDTIKSVDFSDEKRIIETESAVYNAKAVIIASGTEPLKLPVADEKERRGKGIHYCALCDGAFYKNKVVAVVGGGNSALECGLYLSGLASEVIFIIRKNSFRGENKLINRIKSIRNIRIFYNWTVENVTGNGRVTGINIRNTKCNCERFISVDGIFCCIGSEPATDLFRQYIDTDDYGYILTDDGMHTNIKNVFAAGDVRKKDYRQLAVSVSDGAIAALNAQKNILMDNGGKSL